MPLTLHLKTQTQHTIARQGLPLRFQSLQDFNVIFKNRDDKTSSFFVNLENLYQGLFCYWKLFVILYFSNSHEHQCGEGCEHAITMTSIACTAKENISCEENDFALVMLINHCNIGFQIGNLFLITFPPNIPHYRFSDRLKNFPRNFT